MSKMDELFKRKLESHSLPPSVEVWEKVERQLEKKNKPVIWWRAVAAVLVLGGIGWAGYLVQSGKKEQSRLAEQKTVNKTEQQREINGKQQATVVEKQQNKKAIAEKPTTQPSKKKKFKTENKESLPQVAAVEKQVEKTTEFKNEQNAVSATVVKTETSEPANVVAQSQKSEKPIVLEFKLEPITNEVVVAAKQEKKRIKTILAELKNGETNINFKTLKENLFAFNSKKPKAIETQE